MVQRTRQEEEAIQRERARFRSSCSSCRQWARLCPVCAGVI